MAKSGAATSAGILGDATRFADLRQRLLFLIGALVVYRIGTFITVPGVDPAAMQQLFEEQSGTILQMFNMFSGGALERLSIFALGIMPYISASIIMQMATHVVPTLQQLRKEGEAGRRKITLVTGTMFLMWLGEQITERGVGNGISMLILASIISGLPSAIGSTLELVSTGAMNQALPLVLGILMLGVTAFVVFMERAQRRITVNYAKRQQGRRMYAGQTSHLPFKINMSGVIPPIFASSLILFPATIATWFGTSQPWLQRVAASMSPGQPIYIMLYGALIVFFCFFYTALVFNARETADNLKRSGAFIPGIRPGQQTAEYIDKVLTRLTFWGAIYITGVCLLPEFLILEFGVQFYFGGTSLLIIVVVTMDFMSQLQAHMMTHQYEGLLKKANLRGYGPKTS